MNEVIEYVLAVVVIPAAIAAVIAFPFTVKPFRRSARALEAGIGAAICAAFLLSFARELGWIAVARKFVAIEGDSAPFERWHWLGIAAAVLAAASLLVGALRAIGGCLITGIALAAVSVAAGAFVQFPRATVATQFAQAGLVIVAASVFTLPRSSVIWTAWIVFGVYAVFAALGGFASLAVMCGATSLGAFIVAILAAFGGRIDREAAPVAASGAVVIVLGTMSALVACCGAVYDTNGVPGWAWFSVPFIPLASLLFGKRIARNPRPSGKTFWRVLGCAIAAVALLATVAIATPVLKQRADDAQVDMYGTGS